MNTQLLIEPVIDGKTHGTALQAKKFSFDLKITNCGDGPSEEFIITQIVLKSSEGQDIVDDFGKKQFSVAMINPNQSQSVSIAETGQSMYGLVSVQINITPKDPSKQIVFWQKNQYTGEKTILTSNNRWMDFFYIQSKSNYLQERTNIWIMRLTWVTAFFALVQILPILKKIWDYFF